MARTLHNMTGLRTTGDAPAGRGGFTLIEMLVIILIIAILVGILVPSVYSALERVKRNSTLATVRLLDSACRMYKSDMGDFPDSNSREVLDPNVAIVIDSKTFEGRHRLVQALTGYLGKDVNGNSIDGKDGPGFRLTGFRGTVYGPYNGSEKVKTVSADPNTPPAFVDSFGNEIYYYKFRDPDDNGIEPAKFVNDDNTGGPADADKYARRDPNDPNTYETREFMIISAGPDEEFLSPYDAEQAGSKTDDITNFRSR